MLSPALFSIGVVRLDKVGWMSIRRMRYQTREVLRAELSDRCMLACG